MNNDVDIYELAADLMGRSECGRAIPREVVLRELKKKSPTELCAVIEQALVEFARLTAEGKMIVYDPADLARVREIQRRLK